MDKHGEGKTLQQTFEELCQLIAVWKIEGEALHNEPEYDGGYGTALLRCAQELSDALDL